MKIIKQHKKLWSDERFKRLLEIPKMGLCFGLPGTGKSTFVRDHGINRLVLDLGHNDFKSNEARERFYKKAIKHTNTELDVLCKVKEGWLYDTYPEYFDMTEVIDHGQIKVIFAIPTQWQLKHIIVPRVFERDGDTEFPRLYEKMGLKWLNEWWQIYKKWNSALGHKRCILIETYDDVDWY